MIIISYYFWLTNSLHLGQGPVLGDKCVKLVLMFITLFLHYCYNIFLKLYAHIEGISSVNYITSMQ